MSQAEKEQQSIAKNPIIWVSLIVIGLIIFIFVGSDRGGKQAEKLKLDTPESSPMESQQSQGEINRASLAPAGLRAREYIRQIREQGQPYPFDEIMAKASSYSNEGSLADSHILFFFAAREGHVEAMMMMAEMSDPTLFQAENNLLDKADAIQAYKWYRLALDKGFEPAEARLDNLHQWAKAEAQFGEQSAQQLLLNFN